MCTGLFDTLDRFEHLPVAEQIFGFIFQSVFGHPFWTFEPLPRDIDNSGAYMLY